MRPLLQHASRAISAPAISYGVSIARQSAVRSFASRVPSPPSICVRCEYRASVAPTWGQLRPRVSDLLRRRFHKTPNDEQEPNDEKKPMGKKEAPAGPTIPDSNEPIPIQPPNVAPKNEEVVDSSLAEVATPPPQPKVVDNIARVPAEHLPSHREAQRWGSSKRLNKLMDDLLPKLADMTQKVNTYTGTDYTGIEALKREIKEQENLVKARRAAIEESKLALDAALTQQASSQKEVVALLERKHSWSAGDLERYMSLIRSEHVNDQAVREAKESITTAENALEEARAQLEKRERAQYHEEQIWSDTIRRNSTWVTFGLMGLNIFLLLTSLLIFEPYRRKKIVREVKAALEAHKSSMEPTTVPLAQVTAPIPDIETEIENAVETVESPAAIPESVPDAKPPVGASAVPAKLEVTVEDVALEPETAPEPIPEPITEAAAPETIPLAPEGINPQETIDIEEEIKADATPLSIQEKVTFIAKDIVSDRVISMRRVDFSTAVVAAASAGAVITAAMIGLLVRR